MKVLFLSRWFPYPADNGSRIRIFNLIKALGARWEVDLVSFAEDSVTETQQAELRNFCRAVEVVSYRPYRSTSWRARLGLLSTRPRSVVDTDNPEMRQRLAELVGRSAYDVMIASQLEMVMYGATMAVPTRIAEEVELGVFHDAYKTALSLPGRLRRGLTWWKVWQYVRGVLGGYQGVTVASPSEKELIRHIVPAHIPVAVVPNGVDVAACSEDFGVPEPDTLVYAGALTYHANYDAVGFFLREVFPRILTVRPNIRFYVTGNTAGVRLDDLPQHPNVVFTGYLVDVRPRVAQSWVSVVPLRIGGGTRLKVLESLALGTPVVSTSKGAQGLNLQEGREVLIADDPQSLAEASLRVLGNLELRSQLSVHGRAAALRFDWAQIGHGLTDFILRTGQAPATHFHLTRP